MDNIKEIHTSSANEILNKKEVYEKTVSISIDKLEKEIIPKWRETLGKLDQHELEMIKIRIQLYQLNQLHTDHEERITTLENKEELFRTISDNEAEKEIILFLKLYKRKGVSKINILDIVTELRLPAEQIERIMEDLERRELVSERK